MHLYSRRFTAGGFNACRRLVGSGGALPRSALTLAPTAIVYLDRVCILTAAPAIRRDLHLSDAQMGYVFSAFTLVYALMGNLPAGWLVYWFGPRRMLARVVTWWSAMTALTAWSGGTLRFALRVSPPVRCR